MGVLTDFFRATESELRAIYPTWKVPLDTPVRRSGVNPFTKEPIEYLSWDPDPEQIVEDGGSGPPSPSLDMKGLGVTSVATLIAIVHDPSKEIEERFYGGALLGPEDGPWIHELPPVFVAKLAALDGSELERVAGEWAELERADIAAMKASSAREHMLTHRDLEYWRESLGLLASFARASVAEGKRMYMWMCL